MTRLFKNIFVFAGLLLMTACQKKDNTPADLSKVTVTFTSPAAWQTYHKGDTVKINADVTYNAEIVSVSIQVIDTASDSILFDTDHDLHTNNFPVSETWVNTVADSTVLCAKITVFVANTSDKAERTLYFKAQP